MMWLSMALLLLGCAVCSVDGTFPFRANATCRAMLWPLVRHVNFYFRVVVVAVNSSARPDWAHCREGWTWQDRSL